MRVKLNQQILTHFLARSTISQNHWAIKLGISRGHWSEIVNGKHPYPSPKTRKLMVEILGIAFEQLFELETDPVAETDFKAAVADRYMIDREIGQGGMGVVYLARDLKHSRQVAIKSVAAEAVSGIGAEQFLKEIRRTASLQHPNILPLHDSGEAAGQPFYVVPYIQDGSLRDLLEREGSVPLERALRIIRGVAGALQHAHEHRVVHCDIKPENILLSGDHAYVADFGISRAVHSEVFEWADRPALDGSAGTPAYVSPEQASGERVLDARSDVYSLGCVVFEMLSGKPPFTGTKTMEIVAKRFTDETPDLHLLVPDVPHEVATSVSRATELLGQRRHATAAEFVDDLEESAARGDDAITHIKRTAERYVLHPISRIFGMGSATRGGRLLQDTAADLRQSVRSIVKRPGFAAITVLTLALGIGMNSAIFSILYGVLLSPLPYASPDELVRIGRTQPTLPGALLPISPANFVDLRERASTLADIVGETGNVFMVTTPGGVTSRNQARMVTPGYLDVLGLRPALGRTFTAEDALAGAPGTVVLSYGMWEADFGGDSSVVGSTVELDETPYTVIGVAHPEAAMQKERLWVPFRWTETDLGPNRRSNNYVRVYGRLRGTAELAAVSSQLQGLWTEIGAQFPDSFDDSGMRAETLASVLTGNSSSALFMLTGAVGFVLLIACANVANLTLARTEGRTREIAVRAALGASRYRIVRQFVTESMVISLIGGGIGVIAAYLGVEAILATFGSSVPRAGDIGINGIVLSFALGISLLTGLAVGLIPSMLARPDHNTLKEGGRGAAPRVTHLRQTLVVSEVALSLILATGAGLLIRSFWQASNSNPGFNQNNVLIANLWLPPSRFTDVTSQIGFYDQLMQRLEGNNSVTSSGMISMIPMRRFGRNMTVMKAQDNEDLEASFVEMRDASPGYFETMQIPLIRGRTFQPSDYSNDGTRQNVTIINQELARTLFPDRDPIGRRLGWGRDGLEIVGVVGSVKSFGADRRIPPAFYLPTPAAFNVVMRTAGNPTDFAPTFRSLVEAIDPTVSVFRAETLGEIVDRSLGSRKFQLNLVVLFAAVALALGAIGVYGVMSYTVEQRTREMGVRLALGQNPTSLMRLVVLQGTRLSLIGIGIGAVGAFLLRDIVGSFLYQVNSVDAATYLGSVVLLTLIALGSCYVPALRALRVDPLEAMRYE